MRCRDLSPLGVARRASKATGDQSNNGYSDAAAGNGKADPVQPHLDAAKRAGEHQIVEVAEMTDPEHPPGELAEAATERKVIMLQNRGAQSVGIHVLGYQNAGQRARVQARFQAQNLEPPGADRAPGRLGVTIVAREHLLEPLLL